MQKFWLTTGSLLPGQLLVGGPAKTVSKWSKWRETKKLQKLVATPYWHQTGVRTGLAVTQSGQSVTFPSLN